jgi:hypothetical protein
MNFPKPASQSVNVSVNTSKDVQDLLLYIEQSLEYAQLVEEAKKTPKTTQNQEPKQGLIEKLLGLVIANSQDFHGRAIVSENLAKDSQYTAALVSISSLLNATSNFPLLYFAFKDLGILAVPMTALANALILKYTNDSAVATSARKPHSRSWSNWAIAAMLSLNALQSIVAGVGTELLLNSSGLSQLKAQELIKEQINRVETLKQIDSPQYKDALARCESGEKELSQLDKSHPRWQSLFVQLYGTWEQRDHNWENVPLEQLPLCPQVERLREDAYQAYETAKQQLQQSLAVRATMGNDLAFLQQKMPLVYTQNFIPSGELSSGLEASRLAILSFIAKLTQGDWSGLGFPLFFLLLSLITSGFACVMTIALSYRPDTQKSFSEAVQLQRDIWLETHRRELMAQQHKDLND